MYKNKNKKGSHMKEKITLLIALSFLVGLTVYKNKPCILTDLNK